MDFLGPYELGPNDTPENGIYTGDARELAKAIPDGSVDLIFTDPPYARKYLSLYDDFAAIGARALKSGHFMLAYAGVGSKPDVMQIMGKHLDYFFDYVSLNTGNSPILWDRRTISRYKSILAYRKGKNDGLPWCNVLGAWKGGGEDKRFHVWQQDESTARYYIECFSRPGDIVLDFCAGAGTFQAMNIVLGRRYLAFEIDPEIAETARARVRTIQPLLFTLEPEQLRLPEGD